MTKKPVFTRQFKVDGKLTTLNEIMRNLFVKQRVEANKLQMEKIMTLEEAIQKDGQRYLYVKSAITFGKTQYDD